MIGQGHRFPAAQAAFLRARAEGSYQVGDLSAKCPSEVSLVDRMPRVYQQGLRGTCVANAVTALLEYYGDRRTRLSVQYLHAATKEIERVGLERNLACVREGRPLDEGFETVYHEALKGLRMIAQANGGMDAAVVQPYLAHFEDEARAHYAAMDGCLLMSCFRALESRGICRYDLWPTPTAEASPVFGRDPNGTSFPLGAHEDAAKRRMVHGLYLLRTPNNVDAIRGILAGVNGLRPMPVVVVVDFFEGCDGETYAFPETVEDEEGGLVSRSAWLGRHGLLIVGYRDDRKAAGGGYFIIRNSLGEAWGRKGYGRMPYAYLECFALEAGTIRQEMRDYEGDYEGGVAQRRRGGKGRTLLLNLSTGVALVAATIGVGVIFDDPLGLRRKPKSPEDESFVPRPGDEEEEDEKIVYKVFLSCADAAERKALREALASEGVPYAVEFLPQTLETVLAVRVTMPEGDAYEKFAEVLKAHYAGPRREFWTDVAGLSRSRAIYIVKAAVQRWEGGL